jgi:hypothetical protein
MSNSFIELFLATLSGVGAFYLIEALCYEVFARIKHRQTEAWRDEWLEENWEEAGL